MYKTVIATFAPQDAEGVCVYCNHCEPCPAGLNVGLIKKYYDLAKAGDHLAHDHYGKLEVKADRCVKCGYCNSRCPFHVDQMASMQEQPVLLLFVQAERITMFTDRSFLRLSCVLDLCHCVFAAYPLY